MIQDIKKEYATESICFFLLSKDFAYVFINLNLLII